MSYAATRKFTPLVALCGALLVCIALTGCTTDNSSGSATNSITGSAGASTPTPTAAVAAQAFTACTLALEPDATAALGVDPGPGRAAGDADKINSCSFGSAPSLLVVTFISSRGADAYLHAKTNAEKSSPVSPLSGVGDQAFYESTASTIGLDFYKHDYYVAIILFTTAGDPLVKATALAQTLAARL